LAKEVPDEFEQILSPNDLREPAEKVFKTSVLKGMNARQFALLMGWFEQELGVECEHCQGRRETLRRTSRRRCVRARCWR